MTKKKKLSMFSFLEEDILVLIRVETAESEKLLGTWVSTAMPVKPATIKQDRRWLHPATTNLNNLEEPSAYLARYLQSQHTMFFLAKPLWSNSAEWIPSFPAQQRREKVEVKGWHGLGKLDPKYSTVNPLETLKDQWFGTQTCVIQPVPHGRQISENTSEYKAHFSTCEFFAPGMCMTEGWNLMLHARPDQVQIFLSSETSCPLFDGWCMSQLWNRPTSHWQREIDKRWK